MSFYPDTLYNKEYFSKSMAGERNYQLMATWLNENVSFETAIDFGCGNGMLIEQLFSLNKKVLGLDIAKAAIELAAEPIKNFILCEDITTSLFKGKFDLVISLETAEHLPPDCSEQFVENLVNHASGTICFSAAIPGQGGDGHINEQTPEFWFLLFEIHGYEIDTNLTNKFRRYLKKNNCIWWYSNNVQILRKDIP
jgi:2-polyprenyl-3-methyl-5-hydroxy-6-metoxy-1,4-benzoquinol methylase